MWKILFISILYSQSEVKASVASNLEPFLVGASQGAFIGNGGYYWKEFKNSSKALYAYEGPDLLSSLFFPNLFHHEVHGKVVVFECGGGYPNTAIQIYGKGYLYCGNYNGTPSTEQMFHTFDESNGRISMQAVTMPGKYLTMWYYYPCVGASTSCENDNCRFALVYPSRRTPVFEVLKLTADIMKINSKEKRIEILDTGIVVSDGVEGHNITKSLSIIKEIKHTTNWSYKFATANWKFEFEPQEYKFERQISFNDNKRWFDAPYSAIFGLDNTREGRSYTTTSKMRLAKQIRMMVDPGYFDEFSWQIKLYETTTIPFTAKIHRTEFDIHTWTPIHSNLTVHGSWSGQVLRFLPIVCKSKPLPEQSSANLSNGIQKYIHAKKCRILLDADTAAVWDKVHPNDIITDDLTR